MRTKVIIVLGPNRINNKLGGLNAIKMNVGLHINYQMIKIK
jgi:hypothetical protein